jgi:hypothetical protein
MAGIEILFFTSRPPIRIGWNSKSFMSIPSSCYRATPPFARNRMLTHPDAKAKPPDKRR